MPDLIAGQVGFKPGDRLDILLSLRLNQSASRPATGEQRAAAGMSTQTTLQNVEIFAIGEQAPGRHPGERQRRQRPHRPSAQPLALLVDHQDAIIIKYIKDSGGTIDLALRSSDEERIVRTDAVTVDSIAERFRFRVPQEVRNETSLSRSAAVSNTINARLAGPGPARSRLPARRPGHRTAAT